MSTEPFKDSFYIEIGPKYRGSSWTIKGAKVVRMTRGIPALAAGNIAVRVDVEVPVEAFWPSSVALVIEPSRAILAAENIEPESPESDA